MPSFDTLSFKIVNDEDADARCPEVLHRLLHDLIDYVGAHMVKPCTYLPKLTVGQHVISERDHIHMNVQVPVWKDYKNESRRRREWFTKAERFLPAGQLVTMTSEMGVTDPEKHTHHLAYPWKEGKIIQLESTGKFQTPEGEEAAYLLELGKALFDVSKKAIKKREARVEKSKNIVSQLLVLGERHIDKAMPGIPYQNWRRCVARDFYEQFKSPLEYPCSTDVRNALQKVAVFLKIVDFDYFL